MMRYPYTVTVYFDDSAKLDAADREAHAEDIQQALDDWDIPVAAIGWSDNDEYSTKAAEPGPCGDESCEQCYEPVDDEPYAPVSSRGCALAILAVVVICGAFWFGVFEAIKAVAR